MAHEYRPAPMSLAQRAALRSQPPRTLRQPAPRRVYPIVVACVLLLALIAVAGGFEYYYRDRVFPKVHLQTVNLDVGGMTQAGVIAQLRPFSAQQSLRAIAVMAPGHAPILVNGARLGYGLDRGRTAWRAFNAGHSGTDLLQSARSQANVLWKGYAVPLAQSVDQAALRRFLFGLAPLVNRPARAGVNGRLLKVARAQRMITASLLNVVGPFKVYLPFATIPALPLPHPANQRHKLLRHHIKKH